MQNHGSNSFTGLLNVHFYYQFHFTYFQSYTDPQTNSPPTLTSWLWLTPTAQLCTDHSKHARQAAGRNQVPFRLNGLSVFNPKIKIGFFKFSFIYRCLSPPDDDKLDHHCYKDQFLTIYNYRAPQTLDREINSTYLQEKKSTGLYWLVRKVLNHRTKS